MFCFYFWHPMLVRPAMKRLFFLKSKNVLGRFVPSALPHYNRPASQGNLFCVIVAGFGCTSPGRWGRPAHKWWGRPLNQSQGVLVLRLPAIHVIIPRNYKEHIKQIGTLKMPFASPNFTQ